MQFRFRPRRHCATPAVLACAKEVILKRSEGSADASGPSLRQRRFVAATAQLSPGRRRVSRSMRPHLYGRSKTSAPTRRDATNDRQHGYKPDRRPGDSLMGRVRVGAFGRQLRKSFTFPFRGRCGMLDALLPLARLSRDVLGISGPPPAPNSPGVARPCGMVLRRNAQAAASARSSATAASAPATTRRCAYHGVTIRRSHIHNIGERNPMQRDDRGAPA